jgi:hypothetical protein
MVFGGETPTPGWFLYECERKGVAGTRVWKLLKTKGRENGEAAGKGNRESAGARVGGAGAIKRIVTHFY